MSQWRSFKLFIFIALTSAPTTAAAESYLRALGEAYQQQYKGMKALPRNATKEQKDAVNERAFAHATELWKQEKSSSISRYLQLGKNQFNALASKLKASGMLAKMVANKNIADDKPAPAKPGAPASSSPVAGTKTSAPLRTTGPSNTGDAGASDGAKSVNFGGAQENKKTAPTVVDGIIQDR